MTSPPPAPPHAAPAAPPPRPPTPGVGPTPSSSLGGRVLASRTFRTASSAWAWRRSILLGVGMTYGLVKWQVEKVKARKRDWIHDKTVLYWKIYDGGIVEAKSAGSSLNYLLTSSQGSSPEEPPRVMTLFEVIRTLKFIEADDRIHGLIADFSSTSVPAVPAYSLGLAQLEEIQDALLDLRRTKQEKMGTGPDGWKSVAWTDTFHSQGQFLFASAFDEVYTQPTGDVPLVGMGSTVPFFGRLARWLGVEIHAEARNEYKSFVQPYIDEKLTKPQRENQAELLTDLNDNLMTYVARNRYPSDVGQAGLDKVKALSQVGPFTASQAVSNGLLNGATYRQDILDSVLEAEKGGDPDRKLKGFFHYHKTMERALEKSSDAGIDVGVVYLLGTIGDAGEFGTAAVVRGLKEAGEDDTIGAVVLRIDSGGGGVVESDSIWAAVRDLREKHGKVVVASFGNASASGGYLVSTHVDAILAAPSTVTGSIGVASLRPTFLSSFFDRLHITLDSFYTGSRTQDVTHSLTPAELARHAANVDEMYADFKNRVCTGRGVHPELIDLIAGGRVMTGLKAFSLTAPEELIKQIKGLDTPVVVAPDEKFVEVSEAAPSPASSTVKAGAATPSVELAVVVISEDQETSPFAPPEPSAAEHVVDSSVSPIAPTPVVAASDAPASPESNAAAALSSSTEAEQATSATAQTVGPVSGVYPITLGPFGRGLIDGIGGIRDSAVYACELFLANGIAGYKLDHPDMPEEEVIRALLPEAKLLKGDSGELVMQMDVRLKRFPAQKSFWQQIGEASRRGDSMELSTLKQYLKVSAATWVLQLAAGMVSAELEEMGLGDARKGLGLGNATRRGWMRAEWAGLSLR